MYQAQLDTVYANCACSCFVRAYNELTNFSITALESQVYPLDKSQDTVSKKNYIIHKIFWWLPFNLRIESKSIHIDL